MITESSYNSNVAINGVSGRHFDDAVTPALKTISVGFAPTKVRWINLTDRIEWEWHFGMADGTTLKTIADGTRTLDTADVAISVADTNTGVAPVTFKPTFAVTIAAAVILQNKQYQYEILG